MFGKRRVIRSEGEGRHQVADERDYQRRYARQHGYFWLPCHLCGQEFGGHEAWGSLPKPGFDSQSEGICPQCTKERQEAAEQHLRELGRSVTVSMSRWGGGYVQHRVGAQPRGQTTDGLLFEIPNDGVPPTAVGGIE